MTAPIDGDGSRGPGQDGGAPRVVVGVDGSPGSRAALSHAFATAGRRGAFRGLLLGSVALHCAMHAPCPVLVVHPQRSHSTSTREPAMAGA